MIIHTLGMNYRVSFKCDEHEYYKSLSYKYSLFYPITKPLYGANPNWDIL